MWQDEIIWSHQKMWNQRKRHCRLLTNLILVGLRWRITGCCFMYIRCGCIWEDAIQQLHQQYTDCNSCEHSEYTCYTVYSYWCLLFSGIKFVVNMATVCKTASDLSCSACQTTSGVCYADVDICYVFLILTLNCWLVLKDFILAV